ncbi:MAG: transposase [Candidatus Competibacteraceae bacterium]
MGGIRERDVITCFLYQGSTVIWLRFCASTGVPLDSNTVERALKRIIRQRKNSLFYASSHRAQVASILTRLIATWVQAGVNALEYL